MGIPPLVWKLHQLRNQNQVEQLDALKALHVDLPRLVTRCVPSKRENKLGGSREHHAALIVVQ